MKEIKPSKELQLLLKRFGHIDYVLMEPDGQIRPEKELHLSATIFFLETLSQRLEERYRQDAQSWLFRFFCLLLREGYKPEEQRFHITFDSTKATCTQIDLYTFLGVQFCKEHELPIPTDTQRPRANDNYERGYWDAFSDPPYSRQMPKEEISRLFTEINNELFVGLSKDLKIYEWSTEWSNYFEAGNEWWGSYLWTIYNPETNTWVAIGASETD